MVSWEMMVDMPSRWFACAVGTAVGLASSGVASAQPNLQDDKATFTAIFENDSITREDDNYSNGTVFAITTGTKPLEGVSKFLADKLVFPRPKGEAVARRGYSVGHLLYTPDNIIASRNQPNDHPYAAIAYGDTSWLVQQERRLDIFTVELGLVGDSALGEEVQSIIHEITGDQEPQGWDNQIDDEILLNVHYDVQRKISGWRALGRSADLIGTASGSLGNRYTAAGFGGALRWGTGLDQAYGLPRVRPTGTSSAFFTPDTKQSWHLFMSGAVRAVAHSIVIDDSFFRDESNTSVNREVFVADFQVGGVFQRGQYQTALTLVARSPEFEENDAIDTYGAISVSRKF